VLAPLVARLHASGERQALEKVVRVAATSAAVLAVFVFVLIAVFGEWILGVGFGDFYRDALPVLRILMVGQLANVLAGPNMLVLTMTGHHRVALAGTALSATFVLVGAALLAPAHGAAGVALAAAGGILLQNAFLIVRVRRLVGISTHVVLSPRAFRRALSGLELG
jgi:O-antigen/teichoic acid export membrane protein